jgi:hypothetical protein
MCSTCGCRKAEEFQAPMTPADDICVACALHDPEFKSNICKGCQEAMGVKKLSQRQAARFTAEPYDFLKADFYTVLEGNNEDVAFAEVHETFETWDEAYKEANRLSRFTNDKYIFVLSPKSTEPYVIEPQSKDAENFGAEGDASKTTSSLNARFFVGVGSGKDLLGKGKFMKYNDAVAKAKQVAEKEGKARVVSTRGLALWTHDGKGLFQAGTSTEEAKKYYRAEDGSVDMDAYANDYMAAEDGFFGAEINYDARIKLDNKNSAKYIDQSIEDGMEFQDDEGIVESNITYLDAESSNGQSAYAVMWEGKEDNNEGLIYGIEYMSGDEVSDVEWFATKKERDDELIKYNSLYAHDAESKFDKLSDEIAAQYRKKGKSAAEAKRIGQATAAKIGFKKYGKRGMVAKAKRGRTMASEGIMRRRSEIPFAGLTLLVLGYFGATKLRKKVTYDCEDCGCKECEEKKAEGYPEVYDPVQDFLPKYRYPKDSVWSNDYNPADPYRALDYQTVHTDSNTKVDRM